MLSARVVAAAPVVALIGLRATNPRYLAVFDTLGGQARAARVCLERCARLPGHAVSHALAQSAQGAGAMNGLLLGTLEPRALDARVVLWPLLARAGYVYPAPAEPALVAPATGFGRALAAHGCRCAAE